MKTTQRGYGHLHQQLRKTYQQKVNTGQEPCCRCGRIIIPGTPWNLDHDDYDRTRYKGAAHEHCNKKAGAHKRNRLARSRQLRLATYVGRWR